MWSRAVPQLAQQTEEACPGLTVLWRPCRDHWRAHARGERERACLHLQKLWGVSCATPLGSLRDLRSERLVRTRRKCVAVLTEQMRSCWVVCILGPAHTRLFLYPPSDAISLSSAFFFIPRCFCLFPGFVK